MILVFNFASVIRWMLAAMVVCMLIPTKSDAMENRLKHFTLPNGLQVFVNEDHARKVATIQLWVNVGSADEVGPELGISHLIEHMAFKGTKRRGVGKIASEIEALGGETNAYTSWDETVFHVTVPSSEVSAGMDILTDAVLYPSIDPGELDKEKQVVIEEILEGEERPERKISKLIFKTSYVKSPYQYPIIGFKDLVEKMTREDILTFRKKWYVPENMFLLVVGDVDPSKVRDEAARLTADLKPTGFFRPPKPDEPVQEKIRTAIVRDVNTRETRLSMAFHIPSMQGNDVNALDLVGDILGARESSRLIRVLKKEKGLVNSISAHALTPKSPGIMAVSAGLDSKNLESATKAIMEELALLGKQPPSPEELERAKVHIESQHIYARETVQGMARSIGSFQADLGDAYYEEKYLTLNRAVTPDQISAAVKKYLVPPNLSIAVLLPEKDLPDLKDETLEQIVTPFRPGVAEATATTATAEGVVTRTLGNGIRAVLARDDSNPVVAFRIAFLGGKRFENKENEGIMNFIAQMLNKGTGKMTEVDIARKVEDMGGRLSGFSGYDSFGFAGSFFSRYVDDGLKLLAELVMYPTFPEDKLERERNLIINRIRTEPDRPVQYAINVLNEEVFPHHPYGFVKEGTLTTVAGFTAQDLKQTYERYAVPANMVITAVGDINVQEMMGRIEAAFGAIPPRKFDAPEVPAEQPLTKERNKVVRIPRAKAHLAVGFRGTTLADQDRYALEVLNNILAGQGGRLFLQLRDKESLAYVVTSFVRPGIDPGVFAFYMACDDSKLDQAVKGMFGQVERIRKERVSDEELKRGITNLVGNHLIALQSSWSRAENTALNTLYGLGYDYEKEYVAKISAVTVDDVLKAAKKYLDPAKCAVVKIVPEENESRKE
ncbi:MAG: insulinase family protein [Desulfomonile tiedjei]|nr:insulinase family protein [Desulfomonile tiedjei]